MEAPPARVWVFLVDPRRVVACVPGGRLGEVQGERTFAGEVKLALGPLALAYRGRVELAEVDEARRQVKILGKAREREGTDSARLTLESRLAPLPGGGTLVLAHARVDVEGRLAELGRGVLEALAHLVFQDFAACVQASLEAEEAGRAGPARAEALRALPLMWRALSAWLGRVLRARDAARRRARRHPR